MATSFLDYYKMILDKVSFDPRLFSKEYNKATKSLQSHEISDLNGWLHAKGLLSKLREGNILRGQEVVF